MATSWLALSLLAFQHVVSAYPLLARNETVQHLSAVGYGDLVFTLGDVPYLALTTTPSAQCSSFGTVSGMLPFTVLKSEKCALTADTVESLISEYLSGDDVFSEAFLQGIYVSTACGAGATIDAGAMAYLESIGAKTLLQSEAFAESSLPSIVGLDDLAAGPYIASLSGENAEFSPVYRLYEDRYRTFIFGAYPDSSSEGAYKPFPINVAQYQDPLVPVTSKIYSWSDPRPFAGLRIGIKDLYDIKGLQTAGGSRAWASITPLANETAPVIQRIIDLGGQIVGKQKTAQFASGADPWDWYDVQYPFNPRGDEWLTCSASSSGGGCSMAAYDWLDHTIGSDTGSSVRRPASVSGIYGNRPSQGMISLEHVLPLGGAQDTAGVFARDPYKFAYFAKHWYTPELNQDASINGLEPLSTPKDASPPTTVIYDPAYLPVRNPLADALVQQFYTNLTAALNMTKSVQNLTQIILDNPNPQLTNMTYLSEQSSVANQYTQWHEVAKPLIDTWADLHEGRFPPIDPARRPGWVERTADNFTAQDYTDALTYKRTFSEWFNNDFLGQNHASSNDSTTESDGGKCATSALFIYDIGTGGLPSYREEDLLVSSLTDEHPMATYLNYTPPAVLTSGVNFCSFAGCADFTVPIGQVPYFSNVTQVEEMVPVTVSLVVRRGCDFGLFTLIERLADAGVVREVGTGRRAF